MGAIDACLDDLLVLVFEHMPDAGPMEDAPTALCPILTVSKRWHVRTLAACSAHVASADVVFA
jgi:hypothetical protein